MNPLLYTGLRPFALAAMSLAALAVAPFAIAAESAPASVKKFPHPERIRYDGHCMTIDGKDTFIYSAGFHYFRTPRELWRDRFRKIKEAGFNTVETYAPWNLHEREMPAGLDDNSKFEFSELEAWLKMAQEEFGFYTIVRAGPFICAEWSGGAFPRWIGKFAPDKGGYWLRSNAPSYIAWSVHWFDAVHKVIAREQLTNKPVGAKGVIMVQLENEFDHHGTGGKETILRALYQSVKRAGIDVPVFTCLTGQCRGSKDKDLSQVFDCDNYYVGLTETDGCAKRMESLRRRQPDAPGFVTELQGGWFSTIGGSLSEGHYSDERHSRAVHLMSLLGGATGLNPYMFVGGTHFGNWGSRGQTTSYDYNAAIREWGARGPKYVVAQGVSQLVRENEAALLRAEGGVCAIDTTATKKLFGGVRVAPDGTRFVFLLNNDAKTPAAGEATLHPGKIAASKEPVYNIDQNGNKVLINTGDSVAGASGSDITVAFDLAPLESKVLVIALGKKAAEGVWYPKTQTPVARPASLPAPVRIASALRKGEDFAVNWNALAGEKSLPEMGINDQRYTLYRAKFDLTAGELANAKRLLVASYSRDIVTALVNGKSPRRTHPSDAYAASAHRNMDTSYKRLGPDDYDNRFDIGGLLREGANEIVLVYENIGHEHGYCPMEELSGVRLLALGSDDKTVAKKLPLSVATDLSGVVHGWMAPDFNASGWERVALDTGFVIPRKGNGVNPKGDTGTDLVSWYRLEFELPSTPGAQVPWAVRLNASGNGEMYLNGHDIGRHQEKGPQREYYLPECWLKTGPGAKNVLTLGLRRTINGATVRTAEIAPYPDAAEVVSAAR
jgi:hypothetical protein